MGRLTQALARHFDRVTGVDIAPTTIELGRQYNEHGDRVEYVLNERSDLSVLPDNQFDFVYSFIVLQHGLPAYAHQYIREFIRVTRPGGIILFQIPSEAVVAIGSSTSRLKYRLYHEMYLRYRHQLLQRDSPMQEMRGIPVQQVIDLLMRLGVSIKDIRLDGGAGSEWLGFRYCVQKDSVIR